LGRDVVAFGCSIVAHLATFATFLFVAFALGAAVPIVDFFAIMPIERTISSMPISFAGVGVREHILQVMLSGLLGVPPAVAVLIGSMSFLVTLACSAPGGIVYLLYRPSRGMGAREPERNGARSRHARAADRGERRAKPPMPQVPSKRLPPRPFVAATFAMTADGKITTREFSPCRFHLARRQDAFAPAALARRRRCS
jgi:hypothetical protein